MPERIQRVSEIAQGSATATYVSGATGVGISVATKSEVFNTVLWLQENAWLISMTCMVLTFIVMLVFRILEYRLKLMDESRKRIDFRKRHSDLYSNCKQEIPDTD